MECGICGEKPRYVLCQGCGIPLCEGCVKWDLFGHGCGCVVPVYVCPECSKDPFFNPNIAMSAEAER
jgi:hypothetical protein